MNQKTHRILAVLAVGIAGLGGVIGLTDPTGLGVSTDTWEIVGNWMSLAAGIVGVAVTMARALWGTEPLNT